MYMKGGSGSAHGSTEAIVPVGAQQAQMNSMFSTTDAAGSQATTLAPFQSNLGMGKLGGGMKSKGKGKGKGKYGGKSCKKMGGYGLEMVVPAFLLAANQLYRRKGKTVSFRKSRKNRTMRRR